ncbi:branched-chain amino acid transport system permease protein [Paucibacter oligotrophus]|uniref:Branched-chain amino acid transport system permease protein n=1 Tax=Roseateles oligotrophus TaxID=1769250 RepID=A0A840LCQ4_9BURK|nr:branched-chain amino acid ABC transporter permease [Roseateles oligotrophus]MBB4843839.1 branched-chain amino acid transport system permease protein [Roseateles oligotrophus]
MPVSLQQRGLGAWAGGLLLLLAALPPLLAALGMEFYLGVMSRVLIFAIAASSLNLILGFGGMVSFGHAAFVGLGAYTVGMLAEAGVVQAWVAWPLAMLVSALAAALIGAISLRTRGVYFIMITLAFAQMFYYLMVSLKAYGGEDGLPLPQRSLLPGLDLQNDAQFYWLVLALGALVMAALQRWINSPFGQLLQGIKENEQRMSAVGSPVFALQWQAFVLAAALAGLAGALLANLNGLVTPHMLHWSQSGQLLIMLIIGGAGALWGGVLGAAVLLLLEEVLSGYTLHWQMVLGVLLLCVVLFAPKGLAGLLLARKRGAKHE